MERRIFGLDGFRAVEQDGRRVLEGMAILFNRETDLGSFREVVMPGACTKTLTEKLNQVALWNHDSSMPLGRRDAGTLELELLDSGVLARIFLGNRSWDNDAYESVRRGDVQGMSFGFDVVKDTVEHDGADGKPLIRLHEIRLWEVSPVTWPAYEETSIYVRSAVERAMQRIRETTPEPPASARHSDEPSAEAIRRAIEHRRREIALAELEA